MPTTESCADLTMQNTFKARNINQNMTTWLFSEHSTLKVFCMENLRKVYMRTYNFQSVLHADAKTWAYAGTLKVKYLVNAGNFKRKL